MKKTNSLKYIWTTIGEFVPIGSKLQALAFPLLVVALGLFTIPAHSQCDMACQDQVNVSLDTAKNGVVIITPALVFAGNATNCGALNIELYDGYGRKLPSNEVNCSHVGQTITYHCIDSVSRNYCWGYILVEDKAGPNLNCVKDTIYCVELDKYALGLDRFPSGMAFDNCDSLIGFPVAISMNSTEYPCDSAFAGIIERRVVAKDRWGTVAECTDSFWVERVPLDSITCPPDTLFECFAADDKLIKDGPNKGKIDPKYSGVPQICFQIDGRDTCINAYPTGNICKTYTHFKDHEWTICGKGKKIRRTWEIVDWCRDTTISCVQWIKIVDTLPPAFDTVANISEIARPHDCEAKITIPYPTNINDCSGIDKVWVEVSYYDPSDGKIHFEHKNFTAPAPVHIYLPAGKFDGILTVADSCGHHRNDTFEIEVLDRTPPIPVCDEITQTTLDPRQCWSRIYATTFDDGSHDNCCPKLHFAVAKMDTINYWREYWENAIKSHYGESNYIANHAEWQKWINIWLDCNIFYDYVEFGGCDDDNTVVTRVYSKCHLNIYYDPHLHGDSEHLFYCKQTYGHFGAIALSVDEVADLDNMPSQSKHYYADIISDRFRDLYIDYYSECMVEVLVDDKVPPVCTPKPDVTIYCDGVGQGSNHEFASCGASSTHSYNDPTNSDWDNCDTCAYWLALDDLNVRVDPYQFFEEPDWSDNCGATIRVDTTIGSLDDCGEGWFERRWTITDDCGLSTTCSQKVHVVHRSDFEVKFPADLHITCESNITGILDPEGDAGLPVVEDDDCEQIAISYKDETFSIIEDACLKIIRTWTVINWCKYDPDAHYHDYDICASETMYASPSRSDVNRHLKDNGDGYMTYTQVIKVSNSDAPTIDRIDSTIVCANNPDNCIGSATITAFGSDSCTPSDQLKWTILLDEGKTGQFVRVNSPQFGASATISDDFPVGTHVVRFIVQDKCGNQSEQDVEFFIDLCKKPTPYCRNLVIELMPIDSDLDGDIDTGMVRVWASDFDAGSFSYCDQKVVAFSFSSDSSDHYRDFGCDDRGDNSLEIWVTDESGNQDFCVVNLEVQDNMNACSGTPLPAAMIAGTVLTENKEGVALVDVKLDGSRVQPFSTGMEGDFTFGAMPLGGQYNLLPAKDINPTNGLSTLDIVYIQKHILGYEKLGSPYKIIAADVDKSGSVSALDIVNLRKLILGIDQEFKHNTSWRFVPTSYTFSNPVDPFKEDFPENYNIEKLDGNMDVEFIGIKIGDVNGSSSPSELQGAEIRTNRNLTFHMDKAEFTRNIEISVPVTAANFNSITGYQFTMEYNAGQLELKGLEAGLLDINESNFGMIDLSKGVITSSWASAKPISADPNEVLFTMVFTTLDDASIENAISLSSKVTKAEAYTAGNEIQGVTLTFNKESVAHTGEFVLYQNNPNPFNTNTLVSFNLPESTQGSLKIMDVTGKVVKVVTQDFVKGYNEVRIHKQDLNTTGVLYYQLETEKYTATKKMIIVE